MRILIDGDACPVIAITEKIARDKGIELIIFADIYHQIKTDCKLIVVDKAEQSVDIALYNCCRDGDIVITQDYGLASLVLNKGATAVNESGMEYDERNIDYLLMRRHVHARMRRAGIKHQNARKRTAKDDSNYQQALLKLSKNI